MYVLDILDMGVEGMMHEGRECSESRVCSGLLCCVVAPEYSSTPLLSMTAASLKQIDLITSGLVGLVP